MKDHVTRQAAAIGVLSGLVLVLALAWTTTEPAGQTQAFRAPRLPGTDRPNLSGIWQALGTAHWNLEDHSATGSPLPELLGAMGAVPAGTGVVEGGTIPYQPWALEKRQENFANRIAFDPWKREIGDPEAKCYLPGVPRATYMPHPFQILQSTSEIAIAYEFASATRLVHLENHGAAPVDTWMGWSNGRWDGDTLVVEVTGFNGLAWLDRAGNFHSEALRVVERYTPRGPDHLDYAATLDDPNVFTRPWTMRMPLYRRVDDRAQVMDFKCIEFAEPALLKTLIRQGD